MKFLFGFLQLTFVPYFVGVFLFPCPGRNLLTAHHLKSTRKISEFGLMHDYVNAENSLPSRHVCENFLKPLAPSFCFHGRIPTLHLCCFGNLRRIKYAICIFKESLGDEICLSDLIMHKAFNKSTYNLVERQAIPELFRRLPLNSVINHFCLEMNDIDFMRLSSISVSKRYQLYIN